MEGAVAPTASGIIYDGGSARQRPVDLSWSEAGLTLAGPEVDAETIPWGDLNYVDRTPETLSLGRAGNPAWRLRVPLSAPADLLDRLPRAATYGRWIDRIGLGKAAAAFALASAAVAAVVFTAPTWLGPRVPPAWERQIGDAMLGDLRSHTCHTPESRDALTRLVERLDPERPAVRTDLAKIQMVNAVALPGGRVLLFDELVRDAKTPDELAGVLAHEIGHVRERHVMQALLRQFGLTAMMAGSQGSLGNALGGLVSMSYTREAEGDADRYALARLSAANISPQGVADFFDRLRKDDPADGKGAMKYLASHPALAQRAKTFRAAVKPGHVYTPALTPGEFTALKQACQADKRARDFDLF